MLLLNRDHMRSSLTFSEYVEAVERAFRLNLEGLSLPPILAHLDLEDGEFHLKAGGLILEEPLFAIKINAGFYQNPAKYGLPSIQGLIMLASARTGRL
jgi:alanine dehydrogenase